MVQKRAAKSWSCNTSNSEEKRIDVDGSKSMTQVQEINAKVSRTGKLTHLKSQLPQHRVVEELANTEKQMK